MFESDPKDNLYVGLFTFIKIGEDEFIVYLEDQEKEGSN